MDILILGAGMMGQAIAYDLSIFSKFHRIIIGDKDKKNLSSMKKKIQAKNIDYLTINVDEKKAIKQVLNTVDVAISAIPYRYNYKLAKTAIDTHTHFIDLGGNNAIVLKERQLFIEAKKNDVTLIPDSGLAPGLVSIITKDVIEHLDTVHSVQLRVGGLPVHPKPPLNYQIVFSPYGLINEYVEDAIILDHGRILTKKSLTQRETLRFPQPFGKMEAFLTSGGCSTLPYTYRKTISYLDYKTIRYPGHCEKIQTFIDMGLAEEKKIAVKGQTIAPRDLLVMLLMKHVPTKGKDVVLLKVISKGIKNGKEVTRVYQLIDYYDTKHDITAMMRTTGYPVAITAQMIEEGTIQKRGVFCPEEIIPPSLFFTELKKRNINLHIQERNK